MCGICGILGSEDKLLISEMCNTIKHRGPDDEGYFLDTNISLGHRRLSIIDLKSGHQPIHNENETIWIVFNGEIYNFCELKEKLLRNHSFYTRTDTEVIIHCYEEYGLNFLSKLHGMFAFALWDSEKELLILARDPIGKKPLYYYLDGQKLFFASEIKALLKTGIHKEINLDALCAYLSYGYTIGSQSIFRGVNKLLAGHFLLACNGSVTIKKYWDVYENKSLLNEGELRKKLKILLNKSINYRLIADVPIGAFLSGGLDSSTIVALSRPQMPDDFHTFSLGFRTHSELEYARLVSDYYDTNHHEILIGGNEVYQELNKIAWHFDEPLGDAAIINNYFLAKEAKKYVTVVLAGEGGDELFAGYMNYKDNLKYCNFFKFPKINRMINTLFNATEIFPNKHSFDRIRGITAYFAQPNFELMHQQSTKLLFPNDIKLMSNLDTGNIDSTIIFPQPMKNPLNKMLAMDCKNLLPEKFLMKADKATMANSIEERLPLLDKSIVEFAFSVPPNLKLKMGCEKYILKMAMKDILPKSIIERKKQGFNTPVSDWFTSDQLREFIIQTLEDNSLITTYFKKERISKMIENIKKSNIPEDLARITWILFSLGLWHDLYFEKEN
jgi:asparagine synthase (glutamine-hydrolysing)